jgi:hypothetical protein
MEKNKKKKKEQEEEEEEEEEEEDEDEEEEEEEEKPVIWPYFLKVRLAEVYRIWFSFNSDCEPHTLNKLDARVPRN